MISSSLSASLLFPLADLAFVHTDDLSLFLLALLLGFSLFPVWSSSLSSTYHLFSLNITLFTAIYASTLSSLSSLLPLRLFCLSCFHVTFLFLAALFHHCLIPLRFRFRFMLPCILIFSNPSYSLHFVFLPWPCTTIVASS